MTVWTEDTEELVPLDDPNVVEGLRPAQGVLIGLLLAAVVSLPTAAAFLWLVGLL